jgi:hypothetical protein
MGLTLVVRLNGTSDIAWENEYIGYSLTIFEMFPKIQFYDYTKAPTRHKLPDNYHLTFSYSGVDSYVPIVKKWRAKNKTQSMAVVFDEIPAGVINGDESDLRFLDPVNTVIGLTAKGNAKNDTTGFVVRPTA